MANSIAKLAILLTTDASGVGKGFAQAKAAVHSFSGSIVSLASQLGLISGGIGGLSSVGWGVKLAAEAETATVAFKVMLGSAENAKGMLSEIREFAASTPFGGADLRDAARLMMSYGVVADDVMPALSKLGDIAGGNAQKLKSLALVFGQISAAGKLTGGDLLQLVNAGFNPLQVMAGGSAEKYKLLRAEMERGNITIEHFKQAINQATQEGGLFNGMMDEMSQTVEGRWSTLKDEFAAIALTLGEQLLPVTRQMIDYATVLIGVVKELDISWVTNHGNLIKWTAAIAFGVTLAPRIISAIKGIYMGLRAMAAAQATVQALGGPAGWATLATGLGVAVATVAALEAGFGQLDKAVAKAQAAISTTGKDYGELKVDASKLAFKNEQATTRELTKQVESVRRMRDIQREASTGAASRFTSSGQSAAFQAALELKRLEAVNREEVAATRDGNRIAQLQLEEMRKEKPQVVIRPVENL